MKVVAVWGGILFVQTKGLQISLVFVHYLLDSENLEHVASVPWYYEHED